jgi:uncharacterized membrane protein
MSYFEARRDLWRNLIRTLLVGVFGILPLAITFAVLAWVVVLLHNLVGPYSAFGTGLRKLGLTITGCEITAYAIGMIGTVLLVYCVGLVIENGFGRRVHTAIDTSMKRVPILNTVYDASKHVTRMLSRENDSLKGMTPVMCYFGDDGKAATPALMPTQELVQLGDKAYHVVIIPSAPVPFGGALVCVKAEWVKPAECSIDELIGIYMSMGASAPASLGRGNPSTNQPEPARLQVS